MSYKVYVAASSKEMERAQDVIDFLESRGIRVTSTWIEHIRRVGIANEGLTAEQAEKAADENITAISIADTLLLLVPETGICSHGAFWEYGYAYGGGQKFIVVAGQWDRSVFNIKANVCAPTDDAAIEAILNHARSKDAV